MFQRLCMGLALVASLVTTETLMAQEKGHIVIIGASYAKGWQPEQIGGLRVINKGVGGEQSHEVRQRFQRDVIELVPRPDAVVIWGFINDIHRNDRSGMDQTLAAAKQNLAAMVEEAKANGILPVLATELTVRGPKTLKQEVMHFVGGLMGKESYQDYVNGEVLEVNHWIRNFAQTRDIPLLDLQPVLAADDGSRERRYATSDGSHVSEEGYEQLTQYAERVLPPGVFTEEQGSRTASRPGPSS